ncbi:MAG: hypothetical protein AAGA71_04860 [Pseudomonadota bacterium]
MPYVIALILVGAFTANVVSGAIGEPFVGNVVEMLVLFSAAIAFSVGILRSEARAKSKDSNNE